MRLKAVFRRDTVGSDFLFRLFRVMWSRGKPGFGGHDTKSSLAIYPRLFGWRRGGDDFKVMLGLRFHVSRSYGGIYA